MLRKLRLIFQAARVAADELDHIVALTKADVS